MISGALDQLDAVTRGIVSREHEGQQARVLTATQSYPSPIDDVWDAVTNPERIPRWFLPVTGDLRVGGHYQLEGNASGLVRSCDPPHAFSLTWEFGGQVSWVEVSLSESDGRTTLVLEHIAHVDDEKWAEFGPGAVGVGWDMTLLGLATHLSEGASFDPAEGMVWAGSAEGVEFMTRSSDGWCVAAITAGEDADRARAAAARTLAAYTGQPLPDSPS